MGFEPTTSCIRGKRLTGRPQGPHGKERTTPRLKYIESISLQWHRPETIWHMEETPEYLLLLQIHIFFSSAQLINVYNCRFVI